MAQPGPLSSSSSSSFSCIQHGSGDKSHAEAEAGAGATAGAGETAGAVAVTVRTLPGKVLLFLLDGGGSPVGSIASPFERVCTISEARHTAGGRIKVRKQFRVERTEGYRLDWVK